MESYSWCRVRPALLVFGATQLKIPSEITERCPMIRAGIVRIVDFDWCRISSVTSTVSVDFSCASFQLGITNYILHQNRYSSLPSVIACRGFSSFFGKSLRVRTAATLTIAVILPNESSTFSGRSKSLIQSYVRSTCRSTFRANVVRFTLLKQLQIFPTGATRISTSIVKVAGSWSDKSSTCVNTLDITKSRV